MSGKWTARALALAVVVFAGPATAENVCRYAVVAAPGTGGLAAMTLDVAIDCDLAIGREDFRFGYGAGSFAAWHADGRIGYRMALGALARDRSSTDFAATSAGVLAPLGAWLAAPDRGHAVDRLEITFHGPSGIRPLTNLQQADGRHVLLRSDWRFGGYSVFAGRPPLAATAPGPAAFAEPGRPGPMAAEIQIAVLDDGFRLTDADVVAWIERFAGLVARFWAGFPSDRLLVAVTSGGRRGAPFGRVRGGGGATMMLRLDRDETPAFLHSEDWVLTHEMIHLGAPFAPTRQPWFMEGMATYLEPLIRALGGATTSEMVWSEWLRAMPTGAFALSRSGLDGRGHPYWTGGLFFLLAHVEYAKRDRPLALAACFRAIRRELGDAASRSTVDALIQTCDREVGAPVLATLRDRHLQAAPIDLMELWRSLGIVSSAGGVAFSENGLALRRTLFDPRQFKEPET